MTTFTIKINERTKAGKAFRAMTESFLKDAKGIEIKELSSEKEDDIYDPKFDAVIELSKKQIKEGKTTRINTTDIWQSLGLK